LNDIISKSEEALWVTAEVGFALTVFLSYASAYCPAEPASNMDIALRAAGIYRRID
jgi:hypothetical protein